jgi:hypothetical protein
MVLYEAEVVQLTIDDAHVTQRALEQTTIKVHHFCGLE